MSDRVYVLDMGQQKYGDSILCHFGETTVLVDGGHQSNIRSKPGSPSIPDQLAQIFGHGPPFKISLLVVTHFHSDHVGCLPEMVEQGLLEAKWALVADENLSTGRPLQHNAEEQTGWSDLPPVVRRLVSALREESHADVSDDATIQQFVQDAARMEDRYRQLLRALEQKGTRVVRYGRDNPSELIAAFASVGMKILGPSLDHLVICTDAIARFTQDAIDTVSAQISDNAGHNEAALYRSLAGSAGVDATDAQDRPGKGAALNDQSIVLRFRVKGHRILLTGDMQLAKAEVSGLNPHMLALRAEIHNDGPYTFVKLPHHTSYNGLNEAVFNELAEGTVFLAHSGGVDDATHPDPEVLELLESNRNRLQWARTDRNGLITFSLDEDGPRLMPSRGELNDFTRNSADQIVVAEPSSLPSTLSTTSGGQQSTAEAEMSRTQDMVEVIARIPHVTTKVTLTIEVEPQTGSLTHPPTPPASLQSAGRMGSELETPSTQTTDVRGLPALNIAGGRQLPPLLFVTSYQRLVANIGQAEADHLLKALRASGQTVYDELPPRLTDVTQAITQVRRQFRATHQGVVLLGGYDVVPSQKLDVIPAELRRRLPLRHHDPDNFIVWSDAIYGDYDEDGLPELPVSRIPDARSAELMFTAIQAGGRDEWKNRFGVYNVQRPFAVKVFETLKGAGQLSVSEPTGPDEIPSGALAAEAVYLMLHGGDFDGTRFWGEDRDGRIVEAVNVDNIGSNQGSIVFTGCCWGALPVERPAAETRLGKPPVARTPAASMALSFLRAGARAFVGCTGAHYSPIVKPYSYFGGPLHQAFWQLIIAGVPPAPALFQAKINYLEGIPHGQTTPLGQAIEMKILRQYTCLGLGW